MMSGETWANPQCSIYLESSVIVCVKQILTLKPPKAEPLLLGNQASLCSHSFHPVVASGLVSFCINRML